MVCIILFYYYMTTCVLFIFLFANTRVSFGPGLFDPFKRGNQLTGNVALLAAESTVYTYIMCCGCVFQY